MKLFSKTMILISLTIHTHTFCAQEKSDAIITVITPTINIISSYIKNLNTAYVEVQKLKNYGLVTRLLPFSWHASKINIVAKTIKELMANSNDNLKLQQQLIFTFDNDNIIKEVQRTTIPTDIANLRDDANTFLRLAQTHFILKNLFDNNTETIPDSSVCKEETRKTNLQRDVVLKSTIKNPLVQTITTSILPDLHFEYNDKQTQYSFNSTIKALLNYSFFSYGTGSYAFLQKQAFFIEYKVIYPLMYIIATIIHHNLIPVLKKLPTTKIQYQLITLSTVMNDIKIIVKKIFNNYENKAQQNVYTKDINNFLTIQQYHSQTITMIDAIITSLNEINSTPEATLQPRLHTTPQPRQQQHRNQDYTQHRNQDNNNN